MRSDRSLQSRLCSSIKRIFQSRRHFLQLFLTCDCILRRCESFHVDEAMHTVFLHEFRAMTASMLLKPFPKIVGDPDVKRSVSAASENVDVIIFACCAHG